MKAKEKELREKVKALLQAAQNEDAYEDQKYGVTRKGDELLEELKRTKDRLAKIRAAKKALEEEAAAGRARRRGRAEIGAAIASDPDCAQAPEVLTGDAGYFSEENVRAVEAWAAIPIPRLGAANTTRRDPRCAADRRRT